MMQLKAGGSTGGGITEWTNGVSYSISEQVIKGSSTFVCISNHTAGTFYVDWLTNGYWVAMGDAPGHIKLSGRSVAEPGYLLCDGQTVGDSTSGADFAGDTYRELYEYIQDNFGGTYNWSNHDTVNLPDFRGVFPKGAGTTDRTLGKDANGNFYSGVLGTYLQDKMQGHLPFYRKNTSWGYAGGSNFDWMYIHPVITGAPVIAEALTTDGVNGTPRTGMTTEPQSLGITFLIKY
jgi:hypothetical protein